MAPTPPGLSWVGLKTYSMYSELKRRIQPATTILIILNFENCFSQDSYTFCWYSSYIYTRHNVSSDKIFGHSPRGVYAPLVTLHDHSFYLPRGCLPVDDDADSLPILTPLQHSQRVHLRRTRQSSVPGRRDLNQLSRRVDEQPIPTAVCRHCVVVVTCCRRWRHWSTTRVALYLYWLSRWMYACTDGLFWLIII